MNQCPFCEIHLKGKGFLKRHIQLIHKSEYLSSPAEPQKIIIEMNHIQRQLEGGLSPKFQNAFEKKILRLKHKKEMIFQQIQK